MNAKRNRWGAPTPELEKLFDFPAMWADVQKGIMVDWSGVTAVLICLDPKCGEQFGPVFDLPGIAEAHALHMSLAHTRAINFTDKAGKQRQYMQAAITPEAKEHARRIAASCLSCQTTTRTNRGLCATCRKHALHAWAVELGHLEPGAKLTAVNDVVKRMRQEKVEDAKVLYAEYAAYDGALTWPQWYAARGEAA